MQRDLEPLALVATTPYVMVAHPSIGVKTVQELIAYAKPRPGKISWGASTPGTVQHLSGEMFKRLAGIDMVFIPYKGTGAMMPDILGGRLQLAIDNVLVLAPHVRLGALNALAVTTAKRTPILPEVPSLAESGLAGLRHQRLVQHVLRAENAAAHRQEAQHGNSRHRQRARDARAPADVRRNAAAGSAR